MPCEWAIPHMIAGVTAAPRWQCSSASGTVRGSWRAIFLGGYPSVGAAGIRTGPAVGDRRARFAATGLLERQDRHVVGVLVRDDPEPAAGRQARPAGSQYLGLGGRDR